MDSYVGTNHIFKGPNGPLPGEFLKLYPDAPHIARPGEVNAWDNPEFREAVKAANKSQIIIAGIATDVCKSEAVAQRTALSLQSSRLVC